MMHATGLTETKIDANKCNHAGSEHALTAITLEMAKASELSTAQLLAQPRSFLKFPKGSDLHLVSIEDFQVYSEFLNCDLQIMTYILTSAQQTLSAILF